MLYYCMSDKQNKKCCRCSEHLPISHFSVKGVYKDGSTRYQSHCKTCQAAYHREHYLKNKDYYGDKRLFHCINVSDWIREYKKGIKCERCGEDRAPCLDFHHKEPSKKSFAVSAARRYTSSIDRVRAEIDKCIVICANCHRLLHAKEGY